MNVAHVGFFIRKVAKTDWWGASRGRRIKKLKKKKKKSYYSSATLWDSKLYHFHSLALIVSFKCAAHVLSRCPKSAGDKGKPPNLWEHVTSNNFLPPPRLTMLTVTV